MPKQKFAEDAAREVSENSKEVAEPSQQSSTGSKPRETKESGARKTLTKRP
jgi:hypothetical protein